MDTIIIEHPIFIENSEMPSPNDGLLFHYTKFESFLKIIETMQLKSSPLCKMNDLNEAGIDSLDWSGDFLKMIEAEKYVKEKCSVICFSKNYRTGLLCQFGSNHPAMWAHYADNSNGVCFVLDKTILLNLNRNNLRSVFRKVGNVRYCHDCSPNDGIMNYKCSDASEFVRRNCKELFFKKHKDWRQEGEVRFLVESPEFYLNIKGAIKYIILGARTKINEASLERIIWEIITPGTKSYHYLIPQSFAEISRSPFGYYTDAAAYRIQNQICRMSTLAKDYLNWESLTFK